MKFMGFTTCEWQVHLLDIVYEIEWLLHNIMLAIFLQFDEIDAAVHEPKINSKG